MRTIVWDWNGTLLDDVAIVHKIFSEMIVEHGLEAPSVPMWRSLYQHPIQAMYKAIGFDFAKESFESLAARWYDRYSVQARIAEPFEGAVEIVKSFQERGFTQLIISTLEEGLLHEQVRSAGIWDYVDHVSGHHNKEADTKVARAVSVLKRFNTHGWPVTVIGDTTHDAEMAHSLEARCVLIAQGYDAEDKLLKLGVPVVRTLIEVKGEFGE